MARDGPVIPQELLDPVQCTPSGGGCHREVRGRGAHGLELHGETDLGDQHVGSGAENVEFDLTVLSTNGALLQVIGLGAEQVASAQIET